MAGAPTKYSAARVKAICAALSEGATRTAAAQSNGINRDTLREWMQDYPAFSGAVMRAEAEAEQAMSRALHAAATGKEPDWRAAESWLKRRRREEWGDSLDVRKLSDEQIASLLIREAAARSGETEDPDPAGVAARGNGKH